MKVLHLTEHCMQDFGAEVEGHGATRNVPETLEAANSSKAEPYKWFQKLIWPVSLLYSSPGCLRSIVDWVVLQT